MKMRNCSINFHHCHHREGHSESASKVRDLNTRSSFQYANIGFVKLQLLATTAMPKRHVNASIKVHSSFLDNGGQAAGQAAGLAPNLSIKSRVGWVGALE